MIETPVICKCGDVIPEGRIKALKLTDLSKARCVKCSSTQRIAGFPLITGKNTYCELLLVTQEQAANLFAMQERKGQSPGAGMKGN